MWKLGKYKILQTGHSCQTGHSAAVQGLWLSFGKIPSCISVAVQGLWLSFGKIPSCISVAVQGLWLSFGKIPSCISEVSPCSVKTFVKVTQLILCDPMDYTVHRFSRPEYCNGEPFPSPGIELPNPGIELRSLSFQTDSLLAEPQGKPKNTIIWLNKVYPHDEGQSSLL